MTLIFRELILLQPLLAEVMRTSQRANTSCDKQAGESDKFHFKQIRGTNGHNSALVLISNCTFVPSGSTSSPFKI